MFKRKQILAPIQNMLRHFGRLLSRGRPHLGFSPSGENKTDPPPSVQAMSSMSVKNGLIQHKYKMFMRAFQMIPSNRFGREATFSV